jgi:stage II sporulation protein E
MQTKKDHAQQNRWWHRLLLAHLPPGQEIGGAYEMAKGAFLGLSAALFSSVPLLFSVNPLSLALLCAVEGQALPWVLGGILVGVWQSSGSPWYVVSALCVLPLRILARLFLTPSGGDSPLTPRNLRLAYWQRLRTWVGGMFLKGGMGHSAQTSDNAQHLPSLFNEPIHLRAAVAILCALIPSLAIPASGGFAYYDLYGAVFTLALTPTVTTLFSLLVSEPTTRQTPREQVGQLAGGLLLIIGLSLCGRSITILGLAPVVVMGCILSLVSVRRSGLGAGLLIAFTCGVCYDPLTIPLFLLFALIYALLRQAMGEFSLVPAALCALIYLLLCGDPTAFWGLSPSLVAGCLLFSAGRRLHGRLSSESAVPTTPSTPDNDPALQFLEERARHEALIQRLSRISGAFSSIAEMFRQIEKNTAHPGTETLRRLCDEQMEHHCRNCPFEARCLEEQNLAMISTLQSFRQALQEEGKVSEAQFNEEIRARCPNKRAIVQDINHAMTHLSYKHLHCAGGEPFAHECDEVAHLLRDVIRCDEKMPDKTIPHPAVQAIKAYLDGHQIPVERVVVLGKERLDVRLIGTTSSSLTLPAEQFRQDISEILGAPVSRLHCDTHDLGCLTLYTLPTLRADYVHRSMATQQSLEHPHRRGLCGDSLRVFVSEEGIFYALICDGMGKGREAAMTSGSAGVFLERTLLAGVEINTALRMLNHYLLSRTTSPEEEISSTIDLFALNLYTKQGYFLKSGAAPSLILREGRLFRLSSHTLPIGILQAIDTQVIPFEVQAGDHILLMSDGVCDIEGNESLCAQSDWLADYFAGHLPEEDSVLIGELFSLARDHGSCDDMSVISIRIAEDA